MLGVACSASATTFTLDQVADVVAPSTRSTTNTTWFGWETFDATNRIDDSTPNIGTTGAGVNFKTTNGENHRSGSGNLYVASGTLAEQVTVATDGTPGSGFTTIIIQMVTAFGGFPGAISFGDIEGVSPEVVQGVNAAGKGHAWAKWKLPGNAASYTLAISGPAGISGFSFDRVVVDTFHSSTGYMGDTARVTTPPYAFVMNQAADAVTPGTRGNLNTTWFGWETFNEADHRAEPIDDLTPDIGTTSSGARFRTTNGQDHVLGSGNFYFSSGTLAEELTVPTSGTPGSGFTTIILQIVSAQGFGAFAETITLGSVNGVVPTVVESLNNTGTGQLWAIWKIPGNQASYTISINGPVNQPHFSFDRVIVDTLWTSSGYQADSMAASPPSVTTNSTLAVGGETVAYSTQLVSTGGTAPYSYALTAGSLPDGLTLGTSGLISGSPTTAGTSNFTVQITDANGLTALKTFALTVTTIPRITTTSPLPQNVAGAAYSQTFAATGGTAPYTWSVSAGSLPAGLGLNSGTGELSGTLSVAGTFNFTLQVSDANSFTATKAFSLTVIDLTIATASLPAAVKAVAYTATLSGTGGVTPYAWSISSGTLPAGLSLNAATGVISGTPSAAGTSNITVRLTDANSFAVTKALSLTVTATYVKPVLNPVTLGSTTVGLPFNAVVTALNYPKTFSITGLPAGLTAKTVIIGGVTQSVISGRPTVSGVFNVKISASNTAGASTAITVPLTVKALSNQLVGTFAGLVARDATANNNLGSLLSLTTTSVGSFTVKVTTGATTKSSVVTYLNGTAPQIQTTLDGKALSLSISNNLITGTYGSAAVQGWRSTWNATTHPAVSRIGYYSAAIDLADSGDVGVATIPQGYGYATFSVAAAGTLVIAGKTSDGNTLTTSTFIGPNGEIALYTSLYGNLGSVTGKLTLSEDSDGEFSDNEVTGTLTWKKPTTTGRTYPAVFGANPINLNVAGKYLAPTTTGEVLGLPDAGTADVKFVAGGIDLSATEADVTDFTYTDLNAVLMPTAGGVNNKAKATMSMVKGTGAVSGKFTLVETTPALTRANIAFQGQTVRLADGSVKAVGYFLLPQIPVSPQTITTSPILSGAFSIEQ